VLCGVKAAATVDHVPPKTLFPSGRRTQLITIKACAECNRASSGDDEWFRDAIIRRADVVNLPQAQEQLAAARRASVHPNKQPYSTAWLRSRTTIELRTPAGLFVGRTPGFRVRADRFNRVVSKTVRGLHYDHFKTRIASDSTIVVKIANASSRTTSQKLRQLFGGGQPHVVDKEIFWFAIAKPIDNPLLAAWLLVYFNVLPVLVLVTNPPLRPDERAG
jgi:hypothetical protein